MVTNCTLFWIEYSLASVDPPILQKGGSGELYYSK